MSDLISRQAAIDYINHVLTDWSEYKETAIDCLRNLPSAEPEQTCEYWDSESKYCALCRPSAQPDYSCEGCKTPKHICGICMRNYPNITDHYCTGEA